MYMICVPAHTCNKTHTHTHTHTQTHNTNLNTLTAPESSDSIVLSSPLCRSIRSASLNLHVYIHHNRERPTTKTNKLVNTAYSERVAATATTFEQRLVVHIENPYSSERYALFRAFQRTTVRISGSNTAAILHYLKVARPNDDLRI